MIPKGTTNLANLGQFVEIPRDVVGSLEYSVRAAQIAVFGAMGLDKKLKDIRKFEHNFKA